jgi:hypothetical protein
MACILSIGEYMFNIVSIGRTSSFSIRENDGKDGGKKKQNLLVRQVLGVTYLTLSRKVSYSIIKERTIMDLITTLSSIYEKSSINNKVHLIKTLFNLKMME